MLVRTMLVKTMPVRIMQHPVAKCESWTWVGYGAFNRPRAQDRKVRRRIIPQPNNLRRSIGRTDRPDSGSGRRRRPKYNYLRAPQSIARSLNNRPRP
jgi:hypothetical protein